MDLGLKVKMDVETRVLMVISKGFLKRLLMWIRLGVLGSKWRSSRPHPEVQGEQS
jgi:hypothetical protein